VCQAQNVVTIEVAEPTETMIGPQGEFCEGFTIPFSQNSVNATAFIWEFGDPNTDGDVSNAPNPSYTYPSEGTYTVTLTAFSDETCPVTTTEVFEVRPLLAPAIPAQDVFCFDDHSIDFTVGGSYTGEAVFQWSFDGGTPSSSGSENPSGVTFDSPGEKLVTLTISENNCERTVEATIDLHPNPIAAFEVLPNIGCVPLSVTFLNESITESSSRAFDWDFGDGGTSNGVNTSHEYTSPGTYSVSLFLENLNGCLGTSEVTLEDIITVTPSPNALFDFEPKTISVLDPVIEVTDLSEGNILCNYYFDDRVFEDCNFIHNVENLVPQTIRLVVQNEFGCVDEIEAEIFLEDHLIFIPNAFTPDGDGINDLFRPVMEGVLDYQMWIFDRWGTEIFYTDDRRGWDGQGAREDYYLQNQEYTYRIVISEYNQRNYEYFGSVRLIR